MLFKDPSGCCMWGQEGKQGKADVIEAWAQTVAVGMERDRYMQPSHGGRTGVGEGREGAKRTLISLPETGGQ